MNDNAFNWDAASFFERLTTSNKFARQNGFRFDRVSSLKGFHTIISQALSTTALVAVSDTSSGGTDLNNTPHTRRVKTVFLFMRHKADDAKARQSCLDKMNELFRQFMSVLIQEKTHLRENNIYIDDRISFSEIDKYFYTGGACAYFQIAVDTFTNLVYNPDEWLTEIL
ncbi:MAG: hypothetical protein HDS60_03810 [Barnesiella sp.]|nr:hypothetical protein [Barnesiella sp.]